MERTKCNDDAKPQAQTNTENNRLRGTCVQAKLGRARCQNSTEKANVEKRLAMLGWPSRLPPLGQRDTHPGRGLHRRLRHVVAASHVQHLHGLAVYGQG